MRSLRCLVLVVLLLAGCVGPGGLHVHIGSPGPVHHASEPAPTWPPGKCHLNSNGSQTCGYNCRLGSNGFHYCSRHPQGQCRLQANGTWACP